VADPRTATMRPRERALTTKCRHTQALDFTERRGRRAGGDCEVERRRRRRGPGGGVVVAVADVWNGVWSPGWWTRGGQWPWPTAPTLCVVVCAVSESVKTSEMCACAAPCATHPRRGRDRVPDHVVRLIARGQSGRRTWPEPGRPLARRGGPTPRAWRRVAKRAGDVRSASFGVGDLDRQVSRDLVKSVVSCPYFPSNSRPSPTNYSPYISLPRHFTLHSLPPPSHSRSPTLPLPHSPPPLFIHSSFPHLLRAGACRRRPRSDGRRGVRSPQQVEVTRRYAEVRVDSADEAENIVAGDVRAVGRIVQKDQCGRGKGLSELDARSCPSSSADGDPVETIVISHEMRMGVSGDASEKRWAEGRT